jgi:hypothetical protein
MNAEDAEVNITYPNPSLKGRAFFSRTRMNAEVADFLFFYHEGQKEHEDIYFDIRYSKLQMLFCLPEERSVR